MSVKKDVRSISSVGVSSSLGKAGSAAGGGARPVSRAGSSARPAANPADSLKSRFVAMGVFAAAVFGTLSAKLWVMQILESEEFGSASEANKYATVRKPAPRGLICDADGLPLVRNRTSLTVLADPDVADDRDVVLRLSALLGVPYHVVRQRIQDASSGAQSQRVVASDARLRDAAFIAEHSDAFPGVDVEERSVRDYPYGALAAHVLGYTGTVTENDLASAGEGRSIELDDVVGRAGIEQYYDDLLAGDHGERTVVADADGNIVEVVSEVQPTKGSDVRLSLKGPVQYVCDRALAKLIAPEDGTIGTGTGVAGAVVVMDLSDGGIVAMASYPTFDPAVFEGVVSQETWDLYQSEETWNPLMNRAIGGQYPAASTYKTFTSLAALENGFASASTGWTCTGSWDGWGSGEEKLCWNHNGHGGLDLRGGIVQSCDTVFYDNRQAVLGQPRERGAERLAGLPREVPAREPDGGGGGGGGHRPCRRGGRAHPDARVEGRELPGLSRVGGLGGRRHGEHVHRARLRLGDPHRAGRVLRRRGHGQGAQAACAEGRAQRRGRGGALLRAGGGGRARCEPRAFGVRARGAQRRRHGQRRRLRHAFEVRDRSGHRGVQDGHRRVHRRRRHGLVRMLRSGGRSKYVVACVVEHGGGGSSAAAPLGAEALAAVLSYDAGTLDEMGEIAGSTGRALADASKRAMTGRTD